MSNRKVPKFKNLSHKASPVVVLSGEGLQMHQVRGECG